MLLPRRRRGSGRDHGEIMKWICLFLHTVCSFYTQYCQEINISFPKASIPHLKMFQGQLVLRQVQVLNHWHGVFCPAYVWLTILAPLPCRPIKMPTWIHKMFTNLIGSVGETVKIQMKHPWQQGFSVDLPTKLLSCNLQPSPPSRWFNCSVNCPWRSPKMSWKPCVWRTNGARTNGINGRWNTAT